MTIKLVFIAWVIAVSPISAWADNGSKKLEIKPGESLVLDPQQQVVVQCLPDDSNLPRCQVKGQRSVCFVYSAMDPPNKPDYKILAEGSKIDDCLSIVVKSRQAGICK